MRPHAPLVGGKTGFEPRADLCLALRGCMLPRLARVPCKHLGVGSIPTVSTVRNGLLVQRDDTGFAGRESGFESPAVH